MFTKILTFLSSIVATTEGPCLPSALTTHYSVGMSGSWCDFASCVPVQESKRDQTQNTKGLDSDVGTDNETMRGGAGVARSDQRIRRIPFATARPTFHELRRTVLKLVALDSVAIEKHALSQPDDWLKNQNRTREDERSSVKGKMTQGSPSKEVASAVKTGEKAIQGDEDADDAGSEDGGMHEAHAKAGEGAGDGEDKVASKVCVHDTACTRLQSRFETMFSSIFASL